MRLLTAFVIALLSAGCVSLPKDHRSTAAKSISSQSWHDIQPVIQTTPEPLRDALRLEGNKRIAENGQLYESFEIITALVTHAHHPELLMDSEFQQLHAVANGGEQNQLAFATTVAGYVTNPEFGCAQPIYAAYLHRRYPPGLRTEKCSGSLPLVMLTRHEGAKIVWLDIERIKEIHILFASQSQSMASRFGHVALRLVVCPEQELPGKVCDSNLFEHVVLGFRAHVDELSLNTLKALTGKYRAYLFANPFIEVYEEYAIGEFRELYSLPLRLNESQKEHLLHGLANIHWSYAGEYSFFTHNCATILQHALRTLLPEYASDPKLSETYLRPDSFFDAVKASTLADGKILEQLDAAERDGYFFSSTRPFYNLAVQEVRAAMVKPLFKDMESYLVIIPTKRRQAWLEDKPYTARLVKDKHLREAQIMLEEYAILSSERLMIIEGAKYVEQQNLLGKADQIHLILDEVHAKIFDDCLLTPIRMHANPIVRMNGIPRKSGIPSLPTVASICQSEQGRKLLRESIGNVMDTQSEGWQQLNRISQYWLDSIINLKALKSM